jgi:DNA replication protein DnaC
MADAKNTKFSTEWKSAKYWRNRPVEERLRNLRIPPRYRNCSFANFETTETTEPIVKALKKWVSQTPENIEQGNGLYISGDVGTGKTHLAVAALKEAVVEHGVSGLFLPYPVFCEMVHDSRNNNGELPEMYGEPNLLKYLRRVYDIVVIDNFNAARITDYMVTVTEESIQSRYDSQLPTIFTSSDRLDKLPGLFNQRIASIIRRSTYSVRTAGSDYRMGATDGGE